MKPMPPQAVQVPIAAPRSDSGNTATMIASEAGVSSAPNTPCRPRASTSSSTLGASAHPSEAAPKPATPIENTRRSP